MTRVPAVCALALIVLVASQRSSIVRAHDPVPATPTFARDIRPLLAAHCTACHVDGGSAPMPLTTAEELRPWARAIRAQVLTRRMPKWHAARGYGAFLNDATLTPYEQAVFTGWLDAGMPDGIPRAAAVSRGATGFPRGSPEDARIHVAVPPLGDVGRAASSRHTWIRGWAFAPGDPLITAAVISVDGVTIGAWVAGDRPVSLPPGTALRSGHRIRVDVRRRPMAPKERLYVPRRSVLTLLSASLPPARRAWTEQVACGTTRSGASAELLAVRPLLDREEARVSVARPGAPGSLVGWFRDFDPLYPRVYWLVRPIDMALDTRLISDGPCRIELMLANAVTARR